MNGLQYEDHANFLMQMNDSVIASIEVNWLTPMKVRKVSMTCSSGFAEMNYTDQSLEFSSSNIHVDDANLSQLSMDLDTHHLFVKKEEPLMRELESFMQAAEKGTKAQVDGWDALANLKVCNGALRSLTEGSPIEISQ